MLAGNVGRNRYKIAIFVLMSVASAICVMLVAAHSRERFGALLRPCVES
jgi:hypothetical protein